MALQFTTNSTTRVLYCELCTESNHGNYYNGLDVNVLPLINDNNSWHVLCDKHKKEYDIKLNLKIRKDKLEKINGTPNGMGS